MSGATSIINQEFSRYCRLSAQSYVWSNSIGANFPTGRDFLVPWDKGTEVSSLSRDRGTTGHKFLHCPGTKGQWDKLKILSWDGTVQLFGTKGQKFLHCPGTEGQRDMLKILPRDRTGRDSLSKSETGRGMGQ